MRAELISPRPEYEEIAVETQTSGRGKRKKLTVIKTKLQRVKPGGSVRWQVKGQKRAYRTAFAAERAAGIRKRR